MNDGTMRCCSNEIAEILSKTLIDICCVQKSRWRGESAWKITRINSYFKFFWKRDDSGNGGLGVLVAKKWINNVILVV